VTAKVLIYDVETAPLLTYTWGLFDQNIGLNQVKTDRHMLAWAAKWLGARPSDVMYMDQRKAKKLEDDKKLVKSLADLIDEADVVVTQNGKKFDSKIVNARLAFHGLKPPSSHKHIDTCQLAKKHFGFTSNKLEYLSDKLCTKYKKLSHPKFSGFNLWRECLAGNLDAWKEMEKYNKHDVLATEELYTKLAPWGTGVDLNIFDPSLVNACSCGSTRWRRNGHAYYAAGKFQRYQCVSCGAERQDKGLGNNLMSKAKRAALKKGGK
jgi:hypothetical protein